MGSWTYTYDTLNRLVSRDVIGVGAATYLYDAEGRICAVQSGTVDGMPLRTGYIYDADGSRVARGSIASMSCDPGSNGFQFTESYVLDTNGEELTMLDGNGNWQRTNVYGGGRQLATYDSNGLHFQVTDPLGTRRLQTNAIGEPETDIQSLPFGDGLNPYPDPNAPTSTDDATPLHFTGKERDTESGNDYFGARYYASSMGRFLSPDPKIMTARHLANPQKWNKYAYVINNPLANFDPDGMDDFKVFLNFLPGNVDAHSQKQADAQWSQIAAAARQNGHTVEFVKPTVDNYATALQSGSHVIDVGHSLVNPDQQDKAYGINMSGDPNLFVGTNTVEPTMDTMPLNTLLNAPGITAQVSTSSRVIALTCPMPIYQTALICSPGLAVVLTVQTI